MAFLVLKTAMTAKFWIKKGLCPQGPEAVYRTANRWLTVILITPAAFGADREAVRLALEKENIESRPVWKLMLLQPVFRIDGRDPKDNNQNKKTHPARVIGDGVSEDIFNRGLCLPSGTALTHPALPGSGLSRASGLSDPTHPN
jgi:dTDP-4-amino-4,6-dideoxygalactose transaminase